jgi:hypothetical protein
MQSKEERKENVRRERVIKEEKHIYAAERESKRDTKREK